MMASLLVSQNGVLKKQKPKYVPPLGLCPPTKWRLVDNLVHQPQGKIIYLRGPA